MAAGKTGRDMAPPITEACRKDARVKCKMGEEHHHCVDNAREYCDRKRHHNRSFTKADHEACIERIVTPCGKEAFKDRRWNWKLEHRGHRKIETMKQRFERESQEKIDDCHEEGKKSNCDDGSMSEEELEECHEKEYDNCEREHHKAKHKKKIDHMKAIIKEHGHPRGPEYDDEL